MSGRKGVGRRQVCLDEFSRGQTEFILPNLPSPLSASHVDRAFRFWEGNVMILSRPEAPSKASQDTAASLAYLPPGAQLPSTSLSIYEVSGPPTCCYGGGPEVGQAEGYFPFSGWLCPVSWEPKPGSGWEATPLGRHRPLSRDTAFPPKDPPWENISGESLEPLTFAVKFPIFVSDVCGL